MTLIGNNNKEFRITIPSTLQDVDTICMQIEKKLMKAGLEHITFDIILLLREGLNNAVIHGNKRNSSKHINLLFQINEDEVTLEIEDEGTGFDWHNIVKRKVQDSSECGRGMAIFKEYSNGYIYNEKGNKLFIRKEINFAMGV